LASNKAVKDNFKLKYIYYSFKTLIALIILLILIFLFTPPVLFLTILFDRKEGRLYLFFTRLFVRIFFYLNLLNIDNKINYNNIKSKIKKDEKTIYVINHSSLVDGMLIFLLPGKIKFMANEFYGKIPVVGLGIRMMNNVSINRNDEGSQLNQYFQALEILENNYPLAIFPEGTRSRTSKLNKFQNSAFMLALEAKANIVPVIFDTWNVLRPGSLVIRTNDIKVEYLDPIYYEKIKDINYKTISKIVKYKMIKRLLEIRDEKRNRKNYYRNNPEYKKIDNEMKNELIGLKNQIPQSHQYLLK
jgi:1-acyl-sn-glycerol-3-phosphate acyltransferase